MDQHFVPQFYLRAFRDPAVPEGQEPWVWVADLREGAVERRAPKNVGKQANYYAFPETSEFAGDEVEEILSKVESVSAPIVKKLLQGNLDLSEQEWADLHLFMAFLRTRVPFFRDQIEEGFGHVYKMMMRVLANHPEDFARTVRETRKREREFTDEEIEQLRRWVLDEKRYTVREAPEVSLGIGMQLAMETIYPRFSEMSWCFFQADSGDHFITCDSPVSWVDPTPRPPIYGGHGLAMRNVEVTFPIGPALCLVGTWGGPTGVQRARPFLVREFNRRRIAFVDRYAFADSERLARLALEIRGRMEQEAGQ